MIAPIKCSKCGEEHLGIDLDKINFKPGQTIESGQFVKLTEIDYKLELNATIECPKCKTKEFIKDIRRTWRESKAKKENEA